jgi:hypothetical protein
MIHLIHTLNPSDLYGVQHSGVRSKKFLFISDIKYTHITKLYCSVPFLGFVVIILTMKLILALAAVTAANAFTTSPGMFAVRGKTSLQNARPDASSLIAEAMEASKKFGAASVEARLAWETVEEMDASDNRYVHGRSANAVFASFFAHHQNYIHLVK